MAPRKVIGQGRNPHAKRYPSQSKRMHFGQMSSGDVRRLARRGGVKRIGFDVYELSRTMMKLFISQMVGDAIIYSQHCNRKTVMLQDIQMAARRFGLTALGFV